MKNWEKKFDKAFDRLGLFCEVYLITMVAVVIIVNIWRAI